MSPAGSADRGTRLLARAIGVSAAVTIAMLATVPAFAGVPPAVYTGTAYDPGSNANLSSPGSAGNAYTDPTGGLDSSSYSMSLAGTPDPAVSANIVFDYTPYTDVNASAQVFYYFEITNSSGSTAQTPVTADVAAYLSASSFGDGVGGSVFQIQQVSYISGSTVCSTGAPCAVQSWLTCAAQDPFRCAATTPVTLYVNTTESLFSNTQYVVELSAVAGVNYSVASPSGTAGGFVDPGFGIDPATLNASDYSFVFSDGIGNQGPGPVPLPASITLLGLGLAGLGAMRRLADRSRAELQF
jgi:hypothetical protein